jgi:hypothetical protein
MMSTLEWAAQVTVILLLIAVVPLAWRLERVLRSLRGDRAALQAGAQSLGEATRQAETALMRLRATAELAGRQIAEKIASAEPAKEDLRYLVERAEQVADRLEGIVQAARPLAAAPPAASGAAASAPRSEAERGLMRALGLKT